MKKAIRILTPIILAAAIIFCMCWYLFVYDREFTRDLLLSCARFSESQNNHTASTWFYDLAYSHSESGDAVACELAEQYKLSGNYTKAEYTLSNAIADGGGIDIYISLCKTYVEQDKLLDAVNMLNSVTNEEIKQQLDAMRPAAPAALQEPGYYSQYISVTLKADNGTIYVNTDGEYPSLKDTPYTDPIALTDGENTISTVAVSENGLVSPLAVYGYTIGGVVKPMEFSDPAIETAVRNILSVSETAELLTNDLWTIKEFAVPADAKSYADLQHMPFLEKLTIEDGVSSELSNVSTLANLSNLTITNVTVTQEDLQRIAALPMLKSLKLQNCDLAGITPLENATGLVTLDLNNNTIRKLDAVSAMSQLQELNLSHNAVVSLSALSGNTALTKLDVSYNSIETLAPLSGLTALAWLDASTNVITDLGQISQLTALTHLSVATNKLTNVSELSACTALTDLNIASNALTDISALSALTNMLYFNFSYNQIAELPKFPADCALVTVNGSNNQITSLDNLGGLENLNNVHMDYNTEITSVKPLAKCPVLIEVNVYATKVTDVTPLTNQSIIVNYNPVQTTD